jgi:hypothetical protein
MKTFARECGIFLASMLIAVLVSPLLWSLFGWFYVPSLSFREALTMLAEADYWHFVQWVVGTLTGSADNPMHLWVSWLLLFSFYVCIQLIRSIIWWLGLYAIRTDDASF